MDDTAVTADAPARPRWLEWTALGDVVTAPRNPKEHLREEIVDSILEFDYATPGLMDERTGRLVVGHGRLEALVALEDNPKARARMAARNDRRGRPGQEYPDGVMTGDGGRWMVPIVRGWASESDAHAEAYLVADNHLTTKGGWDDRALAEILQDLLDDNPDLFERTGFTSADLDEMLASFGDGEGEDDGGDFGDHEDLDDAPDTPAEPQTQAGDVYLLGPHRLMCGDSADPETWRTVFGDGPKASCVWTDPPYGVNYTGKTKRAMTISGDAPDGAPALFADAMEALLPYLKPSSALYVAHPAGPLALEFGAVMALDPLRLRQTLIWVKDQFVLGHSDYHYKHEPVYFGYTAGRGRAGRGKDTTSWHGDNAQDTIFEVPRPKASRHHPTAKPVALIRAMLINSTRRRDLVADLFTGSGSTLMACAADGRIFRGAELDPGFCDVICARFQAVTGTRPLLEATGEPRDFADLAAAMGGGELV